MRSRALPLVFVLLSSVPCWAQVTWQPTPPPLVTADNETWYRAGEAIEWNGEFYYPAGAPEAFNRYQMVRSGSYRGIPLYTDSTLEPYSIVFVPIGGGRMQPYERPRSGMLAGSAGTRTSAFPSSPATEQIGALGVTHEGFVAQAPAPPTFARAYDLGAAPAAPPAAPVATSGSIPAPAAAPRAVATSGRTTTVSNRSISAAAPTGINNMWLNYNGRRWVSAGRAVELTADFTRTGDYRGFPVFQRRGDSLTIYVPTNGDLVVPFKPRGL